MPFRFVLFKQFIIRMKMSKEFIKMHSIESRFVEGPENIQFAGVCMHL